MLVIVMIMFHRNLSALTVNLSDSFTLITKLAVCSTAVTTTVATAATQSIEQHNTLIKQVMNLTIPNTMLAGCHGPGGGLPPCLPCGAT